MPSPEIEQANGKSKRGIYPRLNGNAGTWVSIVLDFFMFMESEKQREFPPKTIHTPYMKQLLAMLTSMFVCLTFADEAGGGKVLHLPLAMFFFCIYLDVVISSKSK
jgi:hypothetical protein